MSIRRIISLTVLIVAAVLITACGGSSGGGPAPAGGNNPPAGTSPTVISAANSAAIAGAVFNALFTVDDVAGLTNPVALDGATTVDVKSQSSVAAVDPDGEIDDCFVSGRFSLTIAPDVLNNVIAGVLEPGDTFAFGFENCNEGDGLVLDGMFTSTVNAFEGNILTDLFLLDIDVAITEFAVTADGETTTLDADMRVQLDERVAQISQQVISGGSISELGGTSLTDFLITSTIDESGPDLIFTTSGSGAMTDADFEGEVIFNTTTTFQSQGLSNPTIGTLLITGADGAFIQLTPIDATQAELTIDLGDGTAATIQIIAWVDLTG